MKIIEFNQLVQNHPELVFVPRFENERLHRDQLIAPFFQGLTAEKEERLVLLITQLFSTAHQTTNEQHQKKLLELVEQIEVSTSQSPTCTSKTREHIVHCVQAFYAFLKTQQATELQNQPLPTLLDQYTVPVSELETFLAKHDHEHFLKRMSHHINLFLPVPLKKPSRKETLDLSLTPFLDHALLLSSKPTNLEQLREYFSHILAHDSRLLISLQDISEHNQENTRFWRQENLQFLPLIDGWAIQHRGSRELIRSTNQNQQQILPAIIESQLIATKENSEPRVLTHFHFTGWIDEQLCPDINLLEQLLNHIDTLYTPRHPLTINCHAGMGRTGVVATCFLARRTIDQAQLEGIEPARVSINLPKIILELRRTRQLPICGHLSAMRQICQLTTRYFQSRSLPEQSLDEKEQ